MSIQLDTRKHKLRIGDIIAPVRIPDGFSYPLICCAIQIGKQGLFSPQKELSIAMGFGSYSSNRDSTTFDPEAPIELVEVGWNFVGSRGFDVEPFVNTERLKSMIMVANSGGDPF